MRVRSGCRSVPGADECCRCAHSRIREERVTQFIGESSRSHAQRCLARSAGERRPFQAGGLRHRRWRLRSEEGVHPPAPLTVGDALVQRVRGGLACVTPDTCDRLGGDVGQPVGIPRYETIDAGVETGPRPDVPVGKERDGVAVVIDHVKLRKSAASSASRKPVRCSQSSSSAPNALTKRSCAAPNSSAVNERSR